MKKFLSLLSLAVLTVGLLGSCAKINERIDDLDKRVGEIEQEKIASIENQIAAINSSIADLGAIRKDITDLQVAVGAKGEDISELKAADEVLGQRIDELKAYVGDLSKYAEKDWVTATFATLEKQAEIVADVAELKTVLSGLDEKIDQAIESLDSSLKSWVNEQLSAYCTAAQVDAKIQELQNQINTLKTDTDASQKIAELENNLDKLKQDLEAAKATIKTEYEAAIAKAISNYNGTITQTIQTKIIKINATITALTGRVEALETTVGVLTGRIDAIEEMIQSVSITPAYSDGSVEAVDGILTLKCIVRPAEALAGMQSLKDSLLIYADSVKVKTKAATPAYMEIKVSEASVLDAAQGAITLNADISECLPKGADKALTVALKIKNGISDYTTEFVPVYVAVLPDGALKGAFTVNADGKKVYFSKGNLYWDGDSFEFEANQYDFQSSWNSSHVSHFFWSKTASIAYADSYKDNSAVAGDVFFTNATTETAKADFTVNGVTGQYRTLSAEEWKYLINRNGDENIRKGKYKCKVKVCENENCLVLAPDNFTGEIAESYDVSTWTTAEAAGLVCLPAAGSRRNSSLTVDSTGSYWYSSSKDKDFAYYVFFNQYACQLGIELYRYYGFSVRLVTDVI